MPPVEVISVSIIVLLGGKSKYLEIMALFFTFTRTNVCGKIGKIRKRGIGCLPV
jgi:hypothetical protein